MSAQLAPGLLIAAPPLNDPNFVRALILMVAHGEEGALGIVINGEREIACVGDLLEQLGLSEDGRSHREAVRIGGPVQQEIGWIVYQPDVELPREGEIRLSHGVAVTQSREVLAAIGRRAGPPRFAAYLGYTGWAPGQLEEEIREGAWLPMPLDESMVFDVPIARRWEEAWKRAGVAPAAYMSGKRGLA
jgi:putative transcriptional regulator